MAFPLPIPFTFVAQETAPRQVGTTVSISNMFEPLPVRRGEFRRNNKKQFNKLLRTMQAYALISLGVRITVSNTKTKGGKQTHIGTQVGCTVFIPYTIEPSADRRSAIRTH